MNPRKVKKRSALNTEDRLSMRMFDRNPRSDNDEKLGRGISQTKLGGSKNWQQSKLPKQAPKKVMADFSLSNEDFVSQFGSK